MEESNIDDYSDYSDYLTIYSVWPYRTVREDNASSNCAASSSPSRPHIHVRFSHHTVDDIDDRENQIDSRTICLRDDVLADGSDDYCRSFIFSEGLCYWPIDAGTILNIADEVIEKARQFKCNIRVDIRSVQIRGSDVQETYEDDRDFGAAAEAVNGGGGASDGGFIVKLLKRKRIDQEYGGSCCVICLEELTAGTDAGVMPCSHNSFHDDCLSSWLERSLSCPLCRRKISAPAAAAAADSRS